MKIIRYAIVLFLLCSLVFGESLVSKDTSGVYQLRQGETENVAKRNKYAKVYNKSGSRQKRAVMSIGRIHYPDDVFAENPNYSEIDLDIVEAVGQVWDYEVNENGYKIRIWNQRNNVDYIARFRRGKKWIEIAPQGLYWGNGAGERELISKPISGISPIIDNNTYRIIWPDVFGHGLDYRYNLREDEFFKTVVISDPGALSGPTISGPVRLVIVLRVSWDAIAGNGFANGIVPDALSDVDTGNVDEEKDNPSKSAFRDEQDRPVFFLDKPKGWDSAGNTISMRWKLRRRGGRIFAVLSVPKSRLDDASLVYPIFLDTAIPEQEIPDGASDAQSNGPFAHTAGQNGFSATGSSFIWFGYDDNSTRYQGGWRFAPIPIDQGATVDSLILSLYSTSFTSGGRDFPLHLKVTAEATDNPGVWTTNHRPGTGGTPGRAAETATKVDWDAASWDADTWITSPEFADIGTELVNRLGWVSGNAFAIIVRGDDPVDANDFVDAEPYENANTRSALLNATFTPPSTGQVIHITGD